MYKYTGTTSGQKSNTSINGWGVKLTDLTSTDAFAGKLCTYINNKPIKSIIYAFYKSQATSIDLLYLDTSNVINMNNMFYGSSATALDLSNFELNDSVTLTNMFKFAKVSVGYAKDLATATKFNDRSVTYIPSALKFTIKS